MSEEKAVYVVGLYPEHWQRAMTGLSGLRREIERLDHRLITVRVLPPLEAAYEEADRYRDASKHAEERERVLEALGQRAKPSPGTNQHAVPATVAGSKTTADVAKEAGMR